MRFATAAVVLAGLVGFGSPRVAVADETSQLTQVSLDEADDDIRVVVRGSQPPNFTSFTLSDPFRVVLDWAGSQLEGVQLEREFDRGLIRRVRLRQFSSEAEQISRVIVELVQPTTYRVEADGTAVIMHFTPVAVPPPPPGGEPGEPADPEPEPLDDLDDLDDLEPLDDFEGEGDGPLTEPDEPVPPAAEAAPPPPSAPPPAAPAPAPRRDVSLDTTDDALLDDDLSFDEETPPISPPSPAPSRASARQAPPPPFVPEPEPDIELEPEPEPARTPIAPPPPAPAPVPESARFEASPGSNRGLPPEAIAPTAPSDGDQMDQPGLSDPGPRTMTYIGFRQMAGTSRVFVRIDGKAAYRQRMQSGSKFVVELLNTTVNVRNNERALDTTYFDSPVSRIQARRRRGLTRIEIQLRESVPWRIKRIGTTIAIDFVRPS